ncbi:hypothetical protein N7476_010451 [Penicillium atrosanguineum]|uniref:Uncharacterized protein n=1 Tax=Penicillium atrosanguineum TaxID=1132637 RepID=A0A9W9PQ92_9EURO|nr:hypothetical protein N7476_010451 [Penicillium atrosanguineum]
MDVALAPIRQDQWHPRVRRISSPYVRLLVPSDSIMGFATPEVSEYVVVLWMFAQCPDLTVWKASR